jgi:hypothetical protein
MRKFYTCLVLLSAFLTPLVKAQAQVNYVFSTSQSTYTPLVSATRLSMSNPTPVGYYEEDEGFANNVPIGFTFSFNNQNYSKLNINVNGYVTFGAGFTIDVNDRYNINSLAKGPKQAGITGIIAPLWDDLRLQDTFGLKCKTEGVAPNRVFSVEWHHVSWNYNSTDSAISFQMKLYETTNAIDFIYQPMNGPLANANASIGIATCTQCIGNYLSVGDATNTTSTSGVKEYDGISAKPAAGQVYHFEPGTCNTVQALNLSKYNSRSASFAWTASSSNGYDYALTTSPLQPLNFSSTTNNNLSISSLEPGTEYYMHVRSKCSTTGKSGWVTYTFRTPCEMGLPYKENFEGNNNGKIPSCIKTENPSGGNPWQLASLSSLPPYNSSIAIKGDNMQQADAWFVLPATSLEGGKSYRIKFKYKVSDSLGINQKVEIKIGTSLNGNFAGWATIYKNIKLSELSFKDTSLLFAPPTNDLYFVAFRCFSDKTSSSVFIDDIEIANVKPMPVKLMSFTGNRVGEKNVLSWRTAAELKNKAFEVQKGLDGEKFTTIKTIASLGINGNSTVTLDYDAIDSVPFMGNTYYRLKVVDRDNSEFFTQTVVVKSPLPYRITYNKFYPNPVSDVVTAIITSPYNSKGSFVIADTYGRVIVSMPVAVVKGDNIFRVDVSKLSKGIYMSKLTCTLGGETEGKSFIKQ